MELFSQSGWELVMMIWVTVITLFVLVLLFICAGNRAMLKLLCSHLLPGDCQNQNLRDILKGILSFKNGHLCKKTPEGRKETA